MHIMHNTLCACYLNNVFFLKKKNNNNSCKRYSCYVKLHTRTQYYRNYI